MHYRNDPDGTRLPIKVDTATNGEFAPIPLAPVHRTARRLAFEQATTNARRLNLTRRAFLVSACGAATTLLGMNAAYAAAGRRGGFFDVPQEAGVDLQVARSTLDRNEFVFDVRRSRADAFAQIDRHRLTASDGQDAFFLDLPLQAIDSGIERNHALAQFNIAVNQGLNRIGDLALHETAHFGDLARDLLQIGIECLGGVVDSC